MTYMQSLLHLSIIDASSPDIYRMSASIEDRSTLQTCRLWRRWGHDWWWWFARCWICKERRCVSCENKKPLLAPKYNIFHRDIRLSSRFSTVLQVIFSLTPPSQFLASNILCKKFYFFLKKIINELPIECCLMYRVMFTRTFQSILEQKRPKP